MTKSKPKSSTKSSTKPKIKPKSNTKSGDTHSLALAAEFAPATREQWRKLVDAVLKGARFEDRLVATTTDGLTIAPLHAHATGPGPIAMRAPGERWRVMARIDHPDPAASNAEALDELTNGSDGLRLIPTGAIGARDYGIDASGDGLARVLAGVHLDAGITIALEDSPHHPDAAMALADAVERSNAKPAAVDLRFGLDPISGFARHGAWPAPWKAISHRLAARAAALSARGFNGALVVADARIIHDAGGSEAQELGYALAVAVAYLRALEAGGIALDAAQPMIAFRLTADADQFLTIAKFRALRLLWRRVEDSCGLAAWPVLLEAETAGRNLTRDDPYTNILRATIAVTAAGLGGADAIAVLPFTAARGLADRFARRLARNTQLVLLDEAGIAHVTDPAAGTGWAEDLTQQLCRAAWTLFQEIETAGGAAAALERGLLQEKVATAAAARAQALAARAEALIGATDYPAVLDAKVVEIAPQPLGALPAAVTCKPLSPVRLAAPFESAN